MSLYKQNGDYYPDNPEPIKWAVDLSPQDLADIPTGSLITYPIDRPKNDFVKFVVLVPTQYQDSAEQLLNAIIQADASGLEPFGNIVIEAASGVEIGDWIDEVIGYRVSDINFASTNFVLIFTIEKENAEALSSYILSAESGGEHSIKRAPKISRLFVLGADDLSGYKKAKIVERDIRKNLIEYRLTDKTAKGEEVLVTEAMANLLERQKE